MAAVTRLLRPYLLVKAITPLDGGLTNCCFKVIDSQDNKYVWRPVNRACELFDIKRAAEFNALDIAAKAGLTAPPLLLLEQGLLTHWVEGLPAQNVSLDDMLGTLGKLHQLPLPDRHFDHQQRAAHYHHKLLELIKSQSDDNLPKDDGMAKIQQLTVLHDRFLQAKSKTNISSAFCHFDFGDYNLIQSPSSGLKLIDFEYAAAGNPLMDLLFFCRANSLDIYATLERYCELNNPNDADVWRTEIIDLTPIVDYLIMLWFELGYRLYGLSLYKESAEASWIKLEEHWS
ncbi:hypothetical protein A8L45_14185 [Veronia pacifica]|uniref:Aminoglycoside phosphotransferase domain-containing protein n=2 Tax=Veronia pacifica TaxID=1080227 RepID=A0A1C3EG65_9GAMM|nr:hypothetical protein A8L45_14185 [Veronia pacifica]